MGLVYRVLLILKALWIVLFENINSLKNLHKKKENFTIGLYT